MAVVNVECHCVSRMFSSAVRPVNKPFWFSINTSSVSIEAYLQRRQTYLSDRLLTLNLGLLCLSFRRNGIG